MAANNKRESGKSAAAAAAASSETSSTAGRYAYEGLDRLIHERARLAILSSLASNESGLTFNDLKDLCALTDGNLSRQLQMLKEAEMVEIEKGTSGNRPQTMCRLTRTGRKRFLGYIAELERVVSNATDRADAAPAAESDDGGGLSMA
jgi:DNA-binding HxlR family transcriptional regulator